MVYRNNFVTRHNLFWPSSSERHATLRHQLWIIFLSGLRSCTRRRRVSLPGGGGGVIPNRSQMINHDFREPLQCAFIQFFLFGLILLYLLLYSISNAFLHGFTVNYELSHAPDFRLNHHISRLTAEMILPLTGEIKFGGKNTVILALFFWLWSFLRKSKTSRRVSWITCLFFCCILFKKMYGQYSRSLADYAKEQAQQIRRREKKSVTGAKIRSKELQAHYGKWFARFLQVLKYIWSKTFAKVGEDWAFLALLGIIMALLSFTMDLGIYMCFTGRFS